MEWKTFIFKSNCILVGQIEVFVSTQSNERLSNLESLTKLNDEGSSCCCIPNARKGYIFDSNNVHTETCFYVQKGPLIGNSFCF